MYPPGFTEAKEEFARMPETIALQKRLLSLEAQLGNEDVPEQNEEEYFEDSDSDDEEAAEEEEGTVSGEQADSGEESSDGGAVVGTNRFALLGDE